MSTSIIQNNQPDLELSYPNVESFSLKVYHIVVRSEVETPLRLPISQPGMALRGAFFSALWELFCNNKTAHTCAECPLHQACPVSKLVAPLRDENERGRDLPRPFALRPASPQLLYQPGETLEFGLTLFGNILPLLPYVVMAANRMGKYGVGTPDKGQRGRFRVKAVEHLNLLSGARFDLLQGPKMQFPTAAMALTSKDVLTRATQLASSPKLELELITPTRLTNKGELVRVLQIRPLLQRLCERLTALEREYGETQPASSGYGALFEQSSQVKVVQNHSRWQEVASYSSRQQRCTPIGGLVGQVHLEGVPTQLLPWLIWGEVIQVGKDVVKGNGCYRLRPA